MIGRIGTSVRMLAVPRKFTNFVMLVVCSAIFMWIILHLTWFGIKRSCPAATTVTQVHETENRLMHFSNYMLAQQIKTTNMTFYSVKASVAKIPKWDKQWPHSYDHKTPDNGLLHRIHHHQKLVSPPVFTAGQRIPRIVHQMWKTKNIPIQMKAWVSKWRATNPDLMYMFWTDVSSREFVAKYYKSLLKTYDDFQFGVQKADMFRYIVLYAFGGVYADLDVEPLKSLDPIRDWAPCILSREPNAHHQVLTYHLYGSKADLNYTLACNAFMACRPGHPFFFYLLSRIVKESVGVTGRNCGLESTLNCTGPETMTRVVTFYKRSLPSHLSHDDIIVADAESFLPTFNDGAIGRLKKTCKKPKLISALGRKICIQLKARNFTNNKVTKKSYTNHHWFSSYHRKESMENFHIHDVNPDAWFMRSYPYDL